jgi:SAM-dependent methyltransferase
MNAFHEANRVRWEHASAGWARGADRRGLWKAAYKDPLAVLLPEELAILGALQGKAVCVLGSGDNQAVFALAGMGAVVTSVDISQKQLDVAKQRAETLGVSVRFVCADVTDLRALADASFDVVYTGGHVAVWVSELATYYSEATRILRPQGLFLINEYHPFRRLWKDSALKLELQFSYFNRGPHTYAYSDNILVRESGDYRCHEFHWTLSDFISAVMNAGNELICVKEVGDAMEGWESTPMQGLPQCLVIAARKRNLTSAH